MPDRYGRVGVHLLHFFPMTSPFGISEQVIVYDRLINAFRIVRVRDDGRMEEECGRCYTREHCPYTMWAAISIINIYQEAQ